MLFGDKNFNLIVCVYLIMSSSWTREYYFIYENCKMFKFETKGNRVTTSNEINI